MQRIERKALLVCFLAVTSLLAVGLFMSGCSGGSSVTWDTGVYVVGWALADEESNLHVPVYWQGGKLFELSRIDATCDGFAESIVVQGGDVHIAGYTKKCSDYGTVRIPTAAYWRNGLRTDLPKPETHALDPSRAYQVVVADGSVYIAGMVTGDNNSQPVPVYWKNGQIFYLNMPYGATVGHAYNLFIDNGDVYVSGVISMDKHYPVYWKNGIPHILPVPNGFKGRNAPYPIVVKDGDVYVFGTIYHIPTPADYDKLPRPVYWKNSEIMPIFPLYSGQAAIAHSGAIEAGIPYSTGDYYEGFLTTPSLWKGESRQRLSMIDENLFGNARDVFIESGIAYVAGYTYIEKPNKAGYILAKPCYWAGGKRVDLPTLPTGYSHARAIFVAR